MRTRMPLYCVITTAIALLGMIWFVRDSHHAKRRIVSLEVEIGRLKAELGERRKSEAELIRQSSEQESVNRQLRAQVETLKPFPQAARREPPPPDAAKSAMSAKQQRRAANLMKLKPQLLDGAPINGVFVVMVDGNARTVPVSFSNGYETRIESDDGIYAVSTTVNNDGTLTYDMRLLERGANPAGLTKIKKSMRFIALPWGEFSLSMGKEGPIFSFLSDLPEPD